MVDAVAAVEQRRQLAPGPEKPHADAVLDEETPSASLPNRRDTLTGAMLIAALSALPAASDPLPDDGSTFVMIDGWVLRHDDLPG